MKWEVLTQGLDLIAFVLVTPEIVGEERLKIFRTFLEDQGPIVNIILSVAIQWITVGGLIAFFAIFNGPRHWMTSNFLHLALSVILSYCAVVAIGFGFVFGAGPKLLSITALVAVRGRLFFTGALCFFLARLISIWLAMHPAAGGHSG